MCIGPEPDCDWFRPDFRTSDRMKIRSRPPKWGNRFHRVWTGKLNQIFRSRLGAIIYLHWRYPGFLVWTNKQNFVFLDPFSPRHAPLGYIPCRRWCFTRFSRVHSSQFPSNCKSSFLVYGKVLVKCVRKTSLTLVSYSFTFQWSDKIMKLDFQEMVMFLQHLRTLNWTDQELEMVLSRAYMWHTMFNSSPSHLASQ